MTRSHWMTLAIYGIGTVATAAAWSVVVGSWPSARRIELSYLMFFGSVTILGYLALAAGEGSLLRRCAIAGLICGFLVGVMGFKGGSIAMSINYPDDSLARAIGAIGGAGGGYLVGSVLGVVIAAARAPKQRSRTPRRKETHRDSP